MSLTDIIRTLQTSRARYSLPLSQPLAGINTCMCHMTSSILEHYNYHMSKSFRDLSWFGCVVDDFVIYDSITHYNYISLVQWLLQHCKDNTVLSIDKCLFFKSQVISGSLEAFNSQQVDTILTLTLLRPSPTILHSSWSYLCSSVSLVNQLSTSTNVITTLLVPLNPYWSLKWVLMV